MYESQTRMRMHRSVVRHNTPEELIMKIKSKVRAGRACSPRII